MSMFSIVFANEHCTIGDRQRKYIRNIPSIQFFRLDLKVIIMRLVKKLMELLMRCS